MDAVPAGWYSEAMHRFHRPDVLAAAQSIIDGGGWCGVERRVDVPTQRWETRLLVCDHAPDLVADALAEEIGYEPGSDARLAGYDRRTLVRNDAIATAVCYVAGAS
jgi:hypothetical protein